MAYRKGYARIDKIYGDSAEDDYSGKERIAAILPHSCDSWVIGGPNEVRQMIDDLQAILAGPWEVKI